VSGRLMVVAPQPPAGRGRGPDGSGPASSRRRCRVWRRSYDLRARATARSSCAFVILERPSIFNRVA